MKQVLLLGATGSIGNSALEVVRANPDIFQIVGASSHTHFAELQGIAPRFKIPHLLNTSQDHNFEEFLNTCEPDIVLNAISGFAGLQYSIQTLQSGIPLALANKESLVAGGELLMDLSRQKRAPIYPVDSEHSAIWQCLEGRKNFKKIFLSCSGGPFRELENLSSVTREQALTHPTWNMGGKITIDSATLANKCLEVFEAMHLFGASRDQIEIVIHPQSIVHSLVQFKDNSILAQLSPPDMKVPIAHALNYPQTCNSGSKDLDFTDLSLTFSKPDSKKFRTLQVLDICTQQMENFPIVFNAANEVAVAAFLDGKISFIQIFDLLEEVIEKTTFEKVGNFDHIYEIDKQARALTQSLIK